MMKNILATITLILAVSAVAYAQLPEGWSQQSLGKSGATMADSKVLRTDPDEYPNKKWGVVSGTLKNGRIFTSVELEFAKEKKPKDAQEIANQVIQDLSIPFRSEQSPRVTNEGSYTIYRFQGTLYLPGEEVPAEVLTVVYGKYCLVLFAKFGADKDGSLRKKWETVLTTLTLPGSTRKAPTTVVVAPTDAKYVLERKPDDPSLTRETTKGKGGVRKVHDACVTAFKAQPDFKAIVFDELNMLRQKIGSTAPGRYNKAITLEAGKKYAVCYVVDGDWGERGLRLYLFKENLVNQEFLTTTKSEFYFTPALTALYEFDITGYEMDNKVFNSQRTWGYFSIIVAELGETKK